MKKYGKKSMNMYVIFGLLLVLFISLGALTMQGNREGMGPVTPEAPDVPEVPVGKPKNKPNPSQGALQALMGGSS
jgi:hypothetical protein